MWKCNLTLKRIKPRRPQRLLVSTNIIIREIGARPVLHLFRSPVLSTLLTMRDDSFDAAHSSCSKLHIWLWSRTNAFVMGITDVLWRYAFRLKLSPSELKQRNQRVQKKKERGWFVPHSFSTGTPFILVSVVTSLNARLLWAAIDSVHDDKSFFSPVDLIVYLLLFFRGWILGPPCVWMCRTYGRTH